jgi:hypothetical protein
MFNQGFQLLNRNELDVELATIFRHWDAEPLQRAEFVGWAWVVASASDMSASENRAAAAELLRAERDSLHRLLADRLMSTSTMSLELVSRRMFLDWLQERLGVQRDAA